MDARSEGSRTGPRRRRLAVAVATLLAGATAVAAGPVAGAASTGSSLVRVGATAAIPATARSTGLVSPSRTMHLGIALEPRSPSLLQKYATEVSTPGSAEFGRYLTPAQFKKSFGPTSASISALEAALAGEGFTLGSLTANGLLLHVTAPASTVERAMGVSLRSYALAGHKSGWAASGAPLLPRSVAPQVAAVLGLDQLTSIEPLLVHPSEPPKTLKGAATAQRGVAKGSAAACAAAATGAKAWGGWTDNEIAKAYGLDGLYKKGDLGAGETIAIFELEPYVRSDISTFDKCYFGADHTSQISDVQVDGGSGSGPGEGEAVLDIEDISALAPDAHMVVYEGPQNDFGNIYASTDEYETIVSKDRANIISTSWGLCEAALDSYAPGTLEVEDYLFEEAAAQGETVFAAAGDAGSDDCAYDTATPVAPNLSVDDPASQPFVVGAGGTSLLSDSEPPSETVWNDGAIGGGGGGGISGVWASPAWQSASQVKGTENAYSDTVTCGATRPEGAMPACREVPDVTLDADEYRGPSVYMASEGHWTTFGGTSSSAPMWAAITAEIAASSGCSLLPDASTSHQRDLGFVSPGLYEVAEDPSTYESSFNDITKGNNDIFDLGGGYPATKGYDLASGLGSPIVVGPGGKAGLASALCHVLGGQGAVTPPRVTVGSLSPVAGSSSGGTAVTITGSGFTAGSVAVDFGGRPSSSVTVDSPTEITATSPALAEPPGTIGEAAGPVDVTVTLETSPVSTSAPSPGAVFDYVPTASNTEALAVRGVGPYGGPLAGGNTVTVYGSGFVADGPVTTVYFGGVATTDFHVVSNLIITAVVPPLSQSTNCASGASFDPANDCQVEVTVASAIGQSPATTILPAYSGPAGEGGNGILEPAAGTEVTPAPSEYDYAPSPTVTAVSPDPANPRGNGVVRIKGSGFNLLTFDWVNFGNSDLYASQQSVLISISPDKIVMDAPPGPLKTEPSSLPGGVSVQSLGGLSQVLPFSYAGTAVLSKLSRQGGPDTGGEKVTISGRGLGDVTSLHFVGGAYTTVYDFTAKSDTSLSFVAPPDLPSVDIVEPCTASGCTVPKTKAERKEATFVVYNVGTPAVSGIAPSRGKNGTTVTIYGDNLDGATKVLFGSKAGRDLRLGSSYPDGNAYSITVKAPSGRAGKTVSVRVVTRSGKTPLSNRARFTYT